MPKYAPALKQVLLNKALMEDLIAANVAAKVFISNCSALLCSPLSATWTFLQAYSARTLKEHNICLILMQPHMSKKALCLGRGNSMISSEFPISRCSREFPKSQEQFFRGHDGPQHRTKSQQTCSAGEVSSMDVMSSHNVQQRSLLRYKAVNTFYHFKSISTSKA